MQQTLTAIVPICDDQLDALVDVLKAIGNPFKDENPYIRFGSTTHFARFVIIPGEDTDIVYPGDREYEEQRVASRLLFCAIFDGDFETFAADLVRLSPDIDAIWSKCDYYNRAIEEKSLHLIEYLRAYEVPVGRFYSTFPHQTVAAKKRNAKLREDSERLLASLPRAQAVETILKMPVERVTPRKPVNRQQVGYLGLYLAWVFLPLAALLGGVVWLLFGQTIRKIRQPVGTYGGVLDQMDELQQQKRRGLDRPVSATTGREDVIAQNQFNLYLTFRPDGRWLRVLKMRILMAVLGFLTGPLGTPGRLGGLTTVHFGHWVLIDKGRRLFFMTCYDGSWENYITDFVNKVYPLLDVQLTNFVGFSPDGTRDINAFRRWLRRVQIQADVFYSAYPDSTVRNLGRYEDIFMKFPRSRHEVDGWLERF